MMALAGCGQKTLSLRPIDRERIPIHHRAAWEVDHSKKRHPIYKIPIIDRVPKPVTLDKSCITRLIEYRQPDRSLIVFLTITPQRFLQEHPLCPPISTPCRSSSYVRYPLRLAERKVQPTRHLIILEMFDPGDYPAMDGANGFDTAHDLFTYNGGVTRAYLDGHAILREPSDVHFRQLGYRNSQFTAVNRWREPYYDIAWSAYWGN